MKKFLELEQGISNLGPGTWPGLKDFVVCWASQSTFPSSLALALMMGLIYS